MLSRPGIWIPVLLFIHCSCPAQVLPDDHFENGHVEVLARWGDSLLLQASPCLHFRLTHAAGTLPRFSCGQEKTECFNDLHRMIYRYEGDTEWTYMDTACIDNNKVYHFRNTSPFVSDTVYIAYWFPWTYRQTGEYVASILSSPYVIQEGIRGFSEGSRGLYGYSITDTSAGITKKRHVVVTCRQHAGESPGNYILKGLTDYLLDGTDSLAAELRSRLVVHFFPLINPDGVALGGDFSLPADPNDCWYPGNPADQGRVSANPETDLLRDLIRAATGGNAFLSIDIHSHPGHPGKFYWWGLLSGPDGSSVSTAENFVRSAALHDKESDPANALLEDHITSDVWAWPGPWCDYWHAETLHAVAFTLETGTLPTNVTPERLEKVGKSLAAALCQVLDKAEDIQEHCPAQAIPETVAITFKR